MTSLEDSIARILAEHWNPIGRFRALGSVYDAYARGVISAYRRDPTARRLHDHLEGLERTSLGVRPLPMEQRARAVELLLETLDSFEA